jgi:hypothetical protein
LSDTGARIAVTQDLQLPKRFYLINIRDGLAYDARVVWNKGTEIGARFASSLSLSANTDLAFSRLRKLWLAKAPR